ncbi:metallophosphoesterase [Kribbella flavida DSM 17836]|uniref:Metallophosphoesterase n=1 Tax=Kribbella flavida (strain DSM 17836 / JCM 10339 / NBRC 14399) TaxID=479435 RepID=D2PQZ3_KRIFD|nr:metallophosphoesterase [Kribbella flavida]ADB31126.1 metallophosphoesterase [Kribbella flavida DSM 17836]
MSVRHRILHLSDTQVGRDGRDEDGVDAVAALERMLHDARHLPDLDLVVVSGDIADDGSVEGCVAVRDRVAAFAAARGIPHVYCTGNHDDRSTFATALGSGHLGPDGTDLGRLMESGGPERVAVSEVNGVRIVTLDSLVPGAAHGALSDRQLQWLANLLETPASSGTVIVVHHPPVYLESSVLMGTVGLRDSDRLASVLAGRDVRAVLCGHFHLQLAATLAGVPVWVTPGVVTRIDLTTPPQLERAVKGASATVVDLGGPFSPTFHVLHARDRAVGEQVYLMDALSGRDVDHED